MFDFNKPKIEITELSEDKKFGRFVVEPLERGYGTTLGNSLRRIMLSSLPGAAVSQVKIDGVLHEFSSIPGVKEDVSDIIMNLKSLAIKNHSTDNEPKTAYIECEGKGVVTAADIQADQDIEIMNPKRIYLFQPWIFFFISGRRIFQHLFFFLIMTDLIRKHPVIEKTTAADRLLYLGYLFFIWIDPYFYCPVYLSHPDSLYTDGLFQQVLYFKDFFCSL